MDQEQLDALIAQLAQQPSGPVDSSVVALLAQGLNSTGNVVVTSHGESGNIPPGAIPIIPGFALIPTCCVLTIQAGPDGVETEATLPAQRLMLSLTDGGPGYNPSLAILEGDRIVCPPNATRSIQYTLVDTADGTPWGPGVAVISSDELAAKVTWGGAITSFSVVFAKIPLFTPDV